MSWSDLEADALTEWPGEATDDVAALLKKSRQGRPFKAASWGTASCTSTALPQTMAALTRSLPKGECLLRAKSSTARMQASWALWQPPMYAYTV